MENKQKVLFICTGNSCRSQIVEGLLNEMAAKNFNAYNARSHPSRVHTNAISIMKEIKIDISNHTSNSIKNYLSSGIDIVITVCDETKQSRPISPKNTAKIHWSINDTFQGWDENKRCLNNFRKTGTELQGRIQKFINEMELS